MLKREILFVSKDAKKIQKLLTLFISIKLVKSK